MAPPRSPVSTARPPGPAAPFRLLRSCAVRVSRILQRSPEAACLLAALAVLGPAPPAGALAGGPEVADATGTSRLQFVETAPVETSLDHPDLPEAFEVWLEMIGAARSSIDLAQFYASDDPDGGSRLTPVIEALESAARRGVRLRFLADRGFHRTYPEVLDRLGARDGIEVRLYDGRALAGGVLHAKYFVVDGIEAYLGSQNFDWRSLTHIQELGARIREPRVARALLDVFETDWALAGGADPGTRTRSADLSAEARPFPVTVAMGGVSPGGDSVRVTPVASPRGWLPDETLWDLPCIIGLIDGACSTVRLQLLTYRATERDGGYFEELESALRRAAARGVTVQLLLSDWCKRPGTIEGLQSLEPLPFVEVRLVTIPPASRGFIPFARVIHAKYLVTDGARAWIGTSNWEGDYFHRSRNLGLIVEGEPAGALLDRFFLDGWNGPYAAPVDPCAAYAPPRIAE